MMNTTQKEQLSGHKISATRLIELQKQLDELESYILKLKEIADRLDPYQPLSQTDIEILRECKITALDNPFTLTNQLLKTMEDALEQRQTLRLWLGKTDDEAQFLHSKITQ